MNSLTQSGMGAAVALANKIQKVSGQFKKDCGVELQPLLKMASDAKVQELASFDAYEAMAAMPAITPDAKDMKAHYTSKEEVEGKYKAAYEFMRGHAKTIDPKRFTDETLDRILSDSTWTLSEKDRIDRMALEQAYGSMLTLGRIYDAVTKAVEPYKTEDKPSKYKTRELVAFAKEEAQYYAEVTGYLYTRLKDGLIEAGEVEIKDGKMVEETLPAELQAARKLHANALEMVAALSPSQRIEGTSKIASAAVSPATQLG